MADTYTIVIQNDGAQAMDFMVFQAQPTLTDGSAAPALMSNSLGTGTLAPYKSSGTRLQFPFASQTYAGAQTTDLSLVAGPSETAQQPIAGGEASDLSLSPFGLSKPATDASVPADHFAIAVPSFAPSAGTDLFCGLTVMQCPATPILSGYLRPAPATTVLCKPSPIFYVALGNTPAGQPVRYDTNNAGCCDFTTGFDTFLVTYAANGTFSAAGQPSG